MSVSRGARERMNVWIGLKCEADLGHIFMRGKAMFICTHTVCVWEEITKGEPKLC